MKANSPLTIVSGCVAGTWLALMVILFTYSDSLGGTTHSSRYFVTSHNKLRAVTPEQYERISLLETAFFLLTPFGVAAALYFGHEKGLLKPFTWRRRLF